ncbi:5-formyltetrahydrofolate cyclo-ligase [Gottschalkia acidurici 9a]|uniref:5-formyltetrahydrofolate cyclo-ligase n=1 Tax=Gottschalkia acidurici (strain ATCC 7906 / DSM 604 / BCRC 14475 / CIP 104303 / KCTC 5404 / NCIMB 10678 / 9a) TaxID=1128398 RepID=K0AVB2_GOTA9|nr:5-formyltetrahydrofolate cyclo-ligase [Gottschalkia acidurici]AFS77214.1 5-formyltetrahydrofolate cyclo-ligase [Gottschalkia acidurici 9a]
MSFLDKKAIRKRMLNIRQQMNRDKVESLSKEIKLKLMKLPIYQKSKTIMLYLSFGNEVDSYELIKACLESGKKVVVPFCVKKDMKIIPTEIKSLDIPLRTHDMGYMEIEEEFVDPVSADEIDLIILPGIAFDKKCYRIGFGAGYYDRFLGELNFGIPTIGVAYDFQIIESFLEMESHDVPLDYVITESRIIIRS